MGGNFKFQVQDSDLEYYLFWRFEKRISLSDKKPPLTALAKIIFKKVNVQASRKSKSYHILHLRVNNF